MKVEETSIEGVKILAPRKFGDHRGFFSEVFSRNTFREAGVDLEFVQDNHSLSTEIGTLRGLHFQSEPFAQAKLVRVTRGAIFDVAVDIRRSSPTFGQHVAVELSAANWKQLFIPIGFAHGFCTLERDVEVVYKVTNYYSAAHDHGIAWDDPALQIAWPAPASGIVLSEKDRAHPLLERSLHLFA